jgi:DNA mismatch endonuclease (patch repair protein)
VFPNRRKVIFVNGCFWHGHDCPRGARVPKTNTAYWTAKIARNGARDASNVAKLKEAGWRALIIWECELKNIDRLKARISRFLS